METRANYAAIGLFTLIVIALGFGFVYWLKRFNEAGLRTDLAVQFAGTVNGLAPGNDVFFNGIKVGNVSGLSFNQADPNKVEVMLSVKGDTPIKADTRAEIAINLLTGVAYVQLQGGTPSGGNILGVAGAKLAGGEGSFGSLLASAGSVVGKVNVAVDRVNEMLEVAAPALKTTLTNTATFTDALAKNSGGVAETLSNVATAAKTINDAAARVQGLIERTDTLVAAVDAAKVRAVVENTDRTMTDVAAAARQLGGVVTNVQQAAADLSRFGGNLNATLDGANAVVARANQIVAAVDPNSIRTVVNDAAALVGRVNEASQSFGQIVADTRTTMANASQFSNGLGTALDNVNALVSRAGAVVAAVDPRVINGAVTEFGDAAKRVGDASRGVATIVADAEKAVASARDFAANLNARNGEINQIVASARTVLADASQFTTGLGTTLNNANGLIANANGVVTRVDGVVAAVDPAKLNTAVNNVTQFTAGLNTTLDNTNGVIARANAAVAAVEPAKVQGAVDAVAAAASKLNDAAGGAGTIVANAGAAVNDARSFVAGITARSADVNAIITDAQAAANSASRFAAGLNTSLDAANGVIGRANGVVAAVDPAQVKVVVDNAAQAAQRVNTLAADAGAVVTSAKSTLDGAQQFVAGINARSGDITAVINDAKATASNANAFVANLNARNGDINRIVSDAKDIAQQLNAASARVGGVIGKLDDALTGPDGRNFFQAATAAANSVARVSEAFERRAGDIANGLGNFTTRGLDDVTALIAEARHALARFDRIGAGLERDPQQLIFGGTPAVRDYNRR